MNCSVSISKKEALDPHGLFGVGLDMYWGGGLQINPLPQGLTQFSQAVGSHLYCKLGSLTEPQFPLP